jgi:mono/diheme cytochrome c family protein
MASYTAMSTLPGFPPTRLLSWRPLANGVGVLSLTLALVPPARSVAAPAPQAKSAPQGGSASAVARGEYLANRVAMCVQCHSTRDDKGVILESKKFRGGVIPFKSPWLDSEWAYQAPSLAGLPGFTDGQIVALLTEGRATGRQPPRSPMPPFRMSPDDAAAIAAYLRGL